MGGSEIELRYAHSASRARLRSSRLVERPRKSTMRRSAPSSTRRHAETHPGRRLANAPLQVPALARRPRSLLRRSPKVTSEPVGLRLRHRRARLRILGHRASAAAVLETLSVLPAQRGERRSARPCSRRPGRRLAERGIEDMAITTTDDQRRRPALLSSAQGFSQGFVVYHGKSPAHSDSAEAPPDLLASLPQSAGR